MVNKIFKCIKCNEYTLKQVCNICKEMAINPKPPRYSPMDKFGKYRRMYNEMVHKAII